MIKFLLGMLCGALLASMSVQEVKNFMNKGIDVAHNGYVATEKAVKDPATADAVTNAASAVTVKAKKVADAVVESK